MRYPDPSLLLRIAIADAYAAAMEYVDPNQNRRNHSILDRLLQFEEYIDHPRHKHVREYTDDAEMSIGNTLVLIEHDAPFTKLQFANAYIREFNYGGRRKGYSHGFQGILEQVKTGAELLLALRPDSRKNGAAMRSVTLGVLPLIQDVLEVATLQASITHNTPEGLFSSRAVALMSHLSLYEDLPLSEIPRYCREHLPEEDGNFFWIFDEVWPTDKPVDRTPNTSVAITTVCAAMTAIMHETSLIGMMKRILCCGGDTDSVAAIAWGIASPRFQSEILPDFMERNLEDGDPKTGAVRLRDLGAKLMIKFS